MTSIEPYSLHSVNTWVISGKYVLMAECGPLPIMTGLECTPCETGNTSATNLAVITVRSDLWKDPT